MCSMLAPVFSLLLTGAAGLVQHGPAIGPRAPAPLLHLSRAERPLAVATSKVLLDDDEEPQAEQVLPPPSDSQVRAVADDLRASGIPRSSSARAPGTV